MTTSEKRAWAAGLFEGEGCIYLQKVITCRTPCLSLMTTDADVLRRFKKRMGMGKIHGPYQYEKNKKPYWQWQVTSFENVQWGIILLWKWLGKRRRNTATKILTRLHGTTVKPSQRTHCPQGHRYTATNTLIVIRRSGDRRGRTRVCRKCAKNNTARYRKANLPYLAERQRAYRQRKGN